MAQVMSIHNTVGTSTSAMRTLLTKIQNALLTRALNAGGLVFKSSSSPLAKTAAAVKYMIGGNMYSKAAADMAALAGTVTADAFNAFYFFVDAAGTLSTVMGTEGATLADVVPPLDSFDGTKACIGFVIVNPTGTGDFVGGTTELDDGTVAPNAVYVDTPAPFWPPIIELPEVEA